MALLLNLPSITTPPNQGTKARKLPAFFQGGAGLLAAFSANSPGWSKCPASAPRPINAIHPQCCLTITNKVFWHIKLAAVRMISLFQ